MATPTAQQALDLMYRASTTGVSNAELAQFGGYAAVKAAAQAASFDATPTFIQSYEQSNALPASASTIANQQAATTTAGTGTTAGTTGMTITKAYQQVLGRTPSQQEIDYWTTQFGPDVDAKELSTFSVAAQPERAAVPTTNNAVRQMYLSVLGREPDASGLKYFSDLFGADVDAAELGAFRGMATQEINANAARNTGTTTGTTTSLTGTTAGTVQPITRPPPVRQVTGTQLAPASFAQTAITGTPFTNLYTPATVQQNAPRLSDIQAAAQSANPYQSLMSLTPQRTLSPAYAAQAGQTTANTNLGGFNPAIYNPATAPVTGLLAPGGSGGSNAGDARGPGTGNTGAGQTGYDYGGSSFGAPGSQQSNTGFFSGLLGRTEQAPAPVFDVTFNPEQTGIYSGGLPVGNVNLNAGELSGRQPTTLSELDAARNAVLGNISNQTALANAAREAASASAGNSFDGRTSGGNYGGNSYGGSYNFAKGGKVNMAPQMNNPPGPDDGYAALDNGEYVIRKSAVKKYGSNIFEQINAGKIPAQRLKSLLE